MRLFTKDIDKKLFAQYQKGSDLSTQMVVAKIFNPYGRGRWYLLNSDERDPDYIWAIVQMGDIVEIGSLSRTELESVRVKPFNLPLERDLHFTMVNAKELFDGLNQGKFYKSGGWVEGDGNKAMVLNQAEGFEHHAEEFETAVKKAKNIPAWVVAKSQRATTDLSDITHYLDGENEQQREEKEGEEYAKGGIVVTSIKDIPDLKQKIDAGKVTYRGLGMGKLANDFYKIAKTTGYRIKVDGKEYFITDEEFDSISRDENGKLKIRFDAPFRRFEKGGYMAKGGEAGVDNHRIYFSSFAEVMDAIHDIAAENGYKVVEIFPDLSYGGVSYGQTKRAKAELEWDGNTKKGKSKNREKNSMNIQIYRMDSGNYELNTYFSYAEGGMTASQRLRAKMK
jgi:hypothetical protein